MVGHNPFFLSSRRRWNDGRGPAVRVNLVEKPLHPTKIGSADFSGV